MVEAPWNLLKRHSMKSHFVFLSQILIKFFKFDFQILLIFQICRFLSFLSFFDVFLILQRFFNQILHQRTQWLKTRGLLD